MQQTLKPKYTMATAWAFFLGMGFAIGTACVGILLTALWHNPLLGLPIGAITGLALGFVLALWLGPIWIRNLNKKVQTDLKQ